MKLFYLLLFFVDFAFAMPRDLIKVGADIGCDPVVDFFDRDGQIEPDYLNMQDGRPNNGMHLQSSFWCKPKTKKDIYWLVFVLDEKPHHQDGCNPILEWSERPRGLSIHPRKLELNMMYELGTNKPIMKKGITSYRPITDAYDGSGYAFYCYQKKWHVMFLH